ncbi:MAG: hypothetical protein CL949_05675 [Erythrobacter sp.]|nr:hypothetical protein [Erythrobacter sp.]|tara:strand:- start:5283 stop:5753 length:471 start_codon:yes stop_codon:yes gene_type:complete
MGKNDAAQANMEVESDPLDWPHVMLDLMAGRLHRFAAYIRRVDGQIDPDVAKRLAVMIDGSCDETEFRLEARRHPDLKSAQKGPHAKIQMARRERKIGNFIAKYILEHGCKREAAFAAASGEFRLSRATIIAIWTRTMATSIRREAALAALRGPQV